jgi:hypothetical protein
MDIDELHAQANGIANAMVKSLATDPEGRVARYLYDQLGELVHAELPPDSPVLHDQITITFRLLALLARYIRDVIHTAGEHGVPISTSHIQSPYDTWFALDDLDKPAAEP